MKLSKKYRSAFWRLFFCEALIVFWLGTVLDMGESAQAVLFSTPIYVVLAALVMCKRRANPTTLDLCLVGYGHLILSIVMMVMMPFAWHLRGVPY
jgi:hypothetical protein